MASYAIQHGRTHADAQPSIAAPDGRKLEKFRALVRYAQAHSPYYARIMQERGLSAETCTPADFPVLTKSALMQNFDEIVTDRRITKKVVADFLATSSVPTDLLFDDYIVMSTSGTSGEVGYFLYSAADFGRLTNAHALRPHIKPPRILLRRLRIALYSSTSGHSAGITSLSRQRSGIKRLFIRGKAFEVNVPLSMTVAQLNEFRPDIIIGYTTALTLLAEEQQAGRLRITPYTVVATGEMVTQEDLAAFRAAFAGCKAVSVYGCTEHNVLAVSNPDGETMTLLDGSVIFECYEDHSIITNLANYTLPMIRYRMSDILEPTTRTAEGVTLVRTVIGRGEQLAPLLNAAGEKCFINPHTLSAMSVPGVRRVQMQLSEPSAFRFLFCVDPNATEQARNAAHANVRRKLQSILQQKGLENVTFDTEIVGDIPANPQTRKYQFIVDARNSAAKRRAGESAALERRERVIT